MLVGNAGSAGLADSPAHAEAARVETLPRADGPVHAARTANAGATLTTVPSQCAGAPRLDAAQRPKPFMVVGLVNGREECARAACPDEALAHMIDWLHADEEAAAVWYLREDWPEPVTVVGRPVRGLVGESRRSAHLFTLEPGTVLYGSLTARCGTELALPQVEWLQPGAGMPCECCLALAPGLAA